MATPERSKLDDVIGAVSYLEAVNQQRAEVTGRILDTMQDPELDLRTKGILLTSVRRVFDRAEGLKNEVRVVHDPAEVEQRVALFEQETAEGTVLLVRKLANPSPSLTYLLRGAVTYEAASSGQPYVVVENHPDVRLSVMDVNDAVVDEAHKPKYEWGSTHLFVGAAAVKGHIDYLHKLGTEASIRDAGRIAVLTQEA